MTQNTQEAYEDFNEAIKLDPDNGDIFHHRGQACVVASLFPSYSIIITSWSVMGRSGILL